MLAVGGSTTERSEGGQGSGSDRPSENLSVRQALGGGDQSAISSPASRRQLLETNQTRRRPREKLDHRRRQLTRAAHSLRRQAARFFPL